MGWVETWRLIVVNNEERKTGAFTSWVVTETVRVLTDRTQPASVSGAPADERIIGQV